MSDSAEIRGRSFPRRCRVTRRSEYLRIYRTARKVQLRHFLVYVRENGRSNSRLGLAVTKKVGRAHERNRIKRLVREVFRTRIRPDVKGLDFVFLARKAAITARKKDLEQEILKRWKQITSP